jgi:hypothetical protein
MEVGKKKVQMDFAPKKCFKNSCLSKEDLALLMRQIL